MYSTFTREAAMFVLHVDLQVKPGFRVDLSAKSRSSLEKTFVEAFRPAISAQDGFAGVSLLRSREDEDHYRLIIAFQNKDLQQKWLATDVHQQVWPAMESHCGHYSVSYYDVV
jgi:heme-degrading monooxygenase HmoA